MDHGQAPNIPLPGGGRGATKPGNEAQLVQINGGVAPLPCIGEREAGHLRVADPEECRMMGLTLEDQVPGGVRGRASGLKFTPLGLKPPPLFLYLHVRGTIVLRWMTATKSFRC
jgi:hypothetical protein